MFDFGELRALLVEHVHGRVPPGAKQNSLAAAPRRLVLDDPKRRQAGGRSGSHQPGAFAMRARLGRSFENAGAKALAAHFHQPEAGDAPDLDPRPVVLQRVLHRFLDFADVARLLHVDEVDDDKARHVAKPKLPGNLGCRLEIGGVGRLLDIVLARRAARVDVDRHQGLGGIDDEITAGLQLDDRLVHRG